MTGMREYILEVRNWPFGYKLMVGFFFFWGGGGGVERIWRGLFLKGYCVEENGLVWDTLWAIGLFGSSLSLITILQ